MERIWELAEQVLERRKKAWERRYTLKPFKGRGKIQGKLIKDEKPGVYIPLGELQKTYPREAFDKLADYVGEGKEGDVFGRLSDHIHEHKKLRKYSGDTLKNLARIR